jgi:hypothetical protein
MLHISTYRVSNNLRYSELAMTVAWPSRNGGPKRQRDCSVDERPLGY